MPTVYEWELIDEAAPSVEETSENSALLELPRDIASDADGDWDLEESGDIRLATGYEAIKIDVESRLRMWKGEAFWNLDEGTDYPTAFDKATSLLALRAIFADRILETPGVKTLTSITLELDGSTRELSVEWRASTDLGELASSTQVGVPT